MRNNLNGGGAGLMMATAAFMAGGDVARGMANAPAAPKPAQAAAPVLKGAAARVAKLITGYSFKDVKKAKDYPNDDGSISRKLSDVLIELAGTGVFMRASVYMGIAKNGDVSFRCSNPSSGTGVRAKSVLVSDDPDFVDVWADKREEIKDAWIAQREAAVHAGGEAIESSAARQHSKPIDKARLVSLGLAI